MIFWILVDVWIFFQLIESQAERSWEILEKSVYTVGRHESADFQLQGECHGCHGHRRPANLHFVISFWMFLVR